MVRDKLGESVFAFASLQEFARRNPETQIVLLARNPYTLLYPATPNVRVVRYRSSAQATLYCLGLRLFVRCFDALLLLKGYGQKTEKLCRLIPARRKISSNPLIRVPNMEYVIGDGSDKGHYYPAWLALKMLDPGLEFPRQLAFPLLMAKRAARQPDYVVVCPVSDEERRCFTPAALRQVLALAAREHPGRRILITVRNEAELALLRDADASGAEIFLFHTLDALIERFAASAHYFGTDTGPLHIALAMGMPATVFFGQSHPDDAVLPKQPAVRRIRLSALGDSNCAVDQCLRGDCIELAVRNATGSTMALPPLQDFCPLKNIAMECLFENRVHDSGYG
jgi:ADP-heptose:LPS heptosyltransferase